jgi:glutathione S-transferase
MYKVFGTSMSGNCYKIKLLLAQLNLDYDWQEIDILQGETRTPEFLAMNPNGKVPTLQIEGDRYLAESNAILCYLADGTVLWPVEKFQKAETLQWLFFEQYSHEPYIAVARFINKFLPADHPRRADLPKLQERGYQALQVLEQHLAQSDFLIRGSYSIADIALYAYTHVAADGGFDLSEFPVIQSWMQRVQQQPGHVIMTQGSSS